LEYFIVISECNHNQADIQHKGQKIKKAAGKKVAGSPKKERS
jgi:hypothetical protein